MESKFFFGANDLLLNESSESSTLRLKTEYMEKLNSSVTGFKEWIAQNRQALLSASVATIIARYSGEGDEGWLEEEIDFLDSDGQRVKAYKPEALVDLFEALHGELAPEGYEDNDGGGGEFHVDVATGRLTHESYSLYVERSYNGLEEY